MSIYSSANRYVLDEIQVRIVMKRHFFSMIGKKQGCFKINYEITNYSEGLL